MTEVSILLVEDSRTDAALVAEALKDTAIPHHLDLASDGEEALRNLRGRVSKPDIILLDLNLPKLGGIEVLRVIKNDPGLRAIPVIILTNSTAPSDVGAAYGNFANAYLRKPVGFDGLSATLAKTSQFWFETVVLPSTPASRVSIPPPAPSTPKRRTSSSTKLKKQK